jgi:general secretion pathway protein F
VPAYSYRAMDHAGVPQRGEIVSGSRLSALEALNRRGLIPIEIRNASPIARQRTSALTWVMTVRALTSRARMSRRELLNLTESLAALLVAGLTVDRALQVCSALMNSNTARTSIESLLTAVRSGTTLQGAFAAGPDRLPPYYLSMIEAGEVGGSLAETLKQLAQLMRRQFEVRERVRSALFYPAILAGMVLTTLILLLTFVLPRFQLMFAEADTQIPTATRVALSIGGIFSRYGWLLALIGSTALAGAVAWVRSAKGRLRFDRWSLTTRWTAQLPAALNTARLFRTVSTLCRNGLSLPAALKVARGTLVNRWLFKVMEDAIRDVQAGEPLSASLSRAGVFPPVAVQLARVGEETGQLYEMLQSAASALEADSHLRLERLLTMIVPAAIILMGLVVAALISSVLIGLLSINDLAS